MSFEKVSRSFMYSINSKGPKIDPCGTSIDILTGILLILQYLTVCSLLVKWAFIKSRAKLLIPYLNNFLYNILRSTVSNALAKSKKVSIEGII